MYPPYWVSSKEGTFQNGEILFSQSLFYGEKTQLLKGGCRIAPIRTKPSKKARQGHGYPSFPSRPCHTALCSWVIASGRRKQIRLGKGESALRVEFKGKIRTQVVPGRL